MAIKTPLREKSLNLTLHQALSRGYFDIVFFAEHFLGMSLHEGQKRYLRSKAEDFRDNRKTKIWLLVPGNRFGKSVVVAILHIWHGFYKIGIARGDGNAIAKASYMTANLAPHSDATKPVFDAIIQILTSSFIIRERGIPARNNECKLGFLLDSAHIRNQAPYYIPFTNRSSVLFRSTGEDKGDSIQGKSFGYISYDEGGRSKHLEYELSSNILPRLGDLGGSLDIVSTPDMRSPSILFHFDLFEKGKRGDRGYYSQEGSAEENIFLPENYVRDMISLYKGDPILKQVLYGEFVFAGDNIYPGDQVIRAKSDELDGGVPYAPGHHYIVGVDTAMGEDEMVYTVLDVTEKPYKVVRQMAIKGSKKSPTVHTADFDSLCRQYLQLNNLQIIIETFNGESAGFYRNLPLDLQMMTFCWGSWQPDGLDSKSKSRRRTIKKEEITLSIRKLLDEDALKIPNESTLVKQLSIYREDDTNIPTDRVISLALACWYATDGAAKHNNEVTEVTW